jgi:hypothetical protein
MSSYFKQPIVCECGHKGFLRLCESGHMDFCESYWLDGFLGGSLAVDYAKGDRGPADILTSLNPVCPQCGRVGAASYVVPRTGAWQWERE